MGLVTNITADLHGVVSGPVHLDHNLVTPQHVVHKGGFPGKLLKTVLNPALD